MHLFKQSDPRPCFPCIWLCYEYCMRVFLLVLIEAFLLSRIRQIEGSRYEIVCIRRYFLTESHIVTKYTFFA